MRSLDPGLQAVTPVYDVTVLTRVFFVLFYFLLMFYAAVSQALGFLVPLPRALSHPLDFPSSITLGVVLHQQS